MLFGKPLRSQLSVTFRVCMLLSKPHVPEQNNKRYLLRSEYSRTILTNEYIIYSNIRKQTNA